MFKTNPYRKGYISMYRTAQVALREFTPPRKQIPMSLPIVRRSVAYRPMINHVQFWNRERADYQRWLRRKTEDAAYDKQKERVVWLKRRISYRNRPLPNKPADIPQRMWDDVPFHFIPHHLPITRPPLKRRYLKNPYKGLFK